MADMIRAEAYGSQSVVSSPGQSYTNPFGNYTLVDSVPEEILHMINPHWYGFPPMNPLWYPLVAMFVGICGVLAVSGNLIVIWVFMNTKALRSPSNYFVVNLALSDFILMFFMFPPVLVNSYYNTWAFSATFCEIYGAIGSFTGCTSIFTMVLISFDRYNVIVKGIGAKPLTTGNAMGQIVAVWLFSAIWTFAPFFGWGKYVPEGNMTACGTDYLSDDIMVTSYVYAYSAWVWALPLLLIVYCYWFIVAAVAAHERAMKEQAKKMGVKSLRGDADAQKKSADCRLAKIAIINVSLWFMAWTPYLVINICGVVDKSMVTPLFSIWGSVFAKANTVYNPIVYAISHPKYKAALYKKLPCLQCSGDSDDGGKSETTSATSTATTANEKA